mmetsp:Transcript_36280/g.116515  ORF Transcript_36280/g.116515 Transcript_36280/m.116515 type:complete len:216 (+) Transcript_36280:543-1190(+)
MSRTVLTSEKVLIGGSWMGSPASVRVTITFAPGSALPSTKTTTLHPMRSGTPTCARQPPKRAARGSCSTSHGRGGPPPAAGKGCEPRDAGKSPAPSQGRLGATWPSSRLARRLARKWPSQRRRRMQALPPRPNRTIKMREVPETRPTPTGRRSSAGSGAGGEGVGGAPGQPLCARRTSEASPPLAKCSTAWPSCGSTVLADSRAAGRGCAPWSRG